MIDNAYEMCYYNDIKDGQIMNITEVKIRLLKKDEGKLKAVATVIIDDCFAVHDIKIIENDNSYFISMPSKKLPYGDYKDIVHPLNNETREILSNAILTEFHTAFENAEKNK